VKCDKTVFNVDPAGEMEIVDNNKRVWNSYFKPGKYQIWGKKKFAIEIDDNLRPTTR
jgi:hypothetical protein